MIITTPALAAAFRLRTQLPVTTKIREYEDPIPPQGRVPKALTKFRRDRIRRLLAEGFTQKQMAAEIGVTKTSINRHLKKIAAGDLGG